MWNLAALVELAVSFLPDTRPLAYQVWCSVQPEKSCSFQLALSPGSCGRPDTGPYPVQTSMSCCLMIRLVFLYDLICCCPSSSFQSPSPRCPTWNDFRPLFCLLCSTELLGDHRPKASQTSRQASDALHAVQPEGKQEGKTPIYGVCFYCLSSPPLKRLQGFEGGKQPSHDASPPPPPPPPTGASPLSYCLYSRCYNHFLSCFTTYSLALCYFHF